MFKNLNRKRQKGQSTLEYAVLIVIIIAALLAMNVYVKRGLQGRLKSSADDIGDQFSPGTSNYTKCTNTDSSTRDTFGVTGIGQQRSALIADEVTNTATIGRLTGNIAEDFMPGATQ